MKTTTGLETRHNKNAHRAEEGMKGNSEKSAYEKWLSGDWKVWENVARIDLEQITSYKPLN